METFAIMTNFCFTKADHQVDNAREQRVINPEMLSSLAKTEITQR